jgi:hypothetical protein
MQLVGYLYEDYHNARSLEHKVIDHKSEKLSTNNKIGNTALNNLIVL